MLRRSLFVLPWIIVVALCGFAFWAMQGRTFAEKELSVRAALIDSLQEELDNSIFAQSESERLRQKAEDLLNNTEVSREEAKRQYAEAVVQSEEATRQAAKARREADAKEVALQGEQQARVQEAAQRRIADARADSIALEQQRTEIANKKVQAGTIAQNSLLVKGEPSRRGLMAVFAMRSMEQAGGNVNQDELIRALQGALEELERTAPQGIDKLGAGPRSLVMQGGDLIALGNDGVLLGVDPAAWRKRVIADCSAQAGATGGRAFPGNGVVLIANAERGLRLCSAKNGALIASQDRTPHADDIIAMAAFQDNKVIVSGDRDGQVVVWAVEGDKLRQVQVHALGGALRGMVHEPRSNQVVVINGTDKATLISKDGTIATASLSDAERAHSLALGVNGEVCIGTQGGRVLALNVGSRSMRQVYRGNAQRVEVLTCGSDGRIALVDAVFMLTVLDARPSTNPFKLKLTGIPTAMSFGTGDVVYLASSDRNIRRAYASSGALADRVCALVGRGWTTEEWRTVFGAGTPERTCSE